jgi:hypothetical protein
MGSPARVVYNRLAMDPPVTAMIICLTALWLVFNTCGPPYQLSGVISTVLGSARPIRASQCSKNTLADHRLFFCAIVWWDTYIGIMAVVPEFHILFIESKSYSYA